MVALSVHGDGAIGMPVGDMVSDDMMKINAVYGPELVKRSRLEKER